MTPKRPPSWKHWEQVRDAPAWLPIMPGSDIWRHRGGLLVISSFLHAEFRGEVRPQFHVSISRGDRQTGEAARPRPEDCLLVLRDFGMENAEEDNHHPGVARHFWTLADPRPGEEGVQCDCKEGEAVVVEPDGYTWSRTDDGGKLPIHRNFGLVQVMNRAFFTRRGR